MISRLAPDVTAGKAIWSINAITRLVAIPDSAPPYTHLSPLRILAAFRVVTKAMTIKRASTPSLRRMSIASKVL